MNELTSFLVNNYLSFNRGASSVYSASKILPMSAVLTPQGIVTQQSPGESFDGIDEKVRHLNPVYQSDIKGKYRLGRQIDSVYRQFMNSAEGKEFINYLQKNGNGTYKTGSIDDILVVNKGKGLVAATMPDLLRKNLIINQDYIAEYVAAASKATGLSQRKIIENILVHELHHIYGQTKSERKGKEKDIEYNNDISLIKFYTGLAQKDIANSDTYLAKAKLFSARYDGNYRKTMDELINGAQKNVYKKVQEDASKSYSDSRSEVYSNAA